MNLFFNLYLKCDWSILCCFSRLHVTIMSDQESVYFRVFDKKFECMLSLIFSLMVWRVAIPLCSAMQMFVCKSCLACVIVRNNIGLFHLDPYFFNKVLCNLFRIYFLLIFRYLSAEIDALQALLNSPPCGTESTLYLQFILASLDFLLVWWWVSLLDTSVGWRA